MLTSTQVPVFVFVLHGGEPYIASIFESMPIIPIFTQVELADDYRNSHIPLARIKELSSLKQIASYIGAAIGYPEIVLPSYLVVDPPDDTFDCCRLVNAAQYLEGLAQESSSKLEDR